MTPGLRLGPIAVAAALASTMAVGSLADTRPVYDFGSLVSRTAEQAPRAPIRVRATPGRHKESGRDATGPVLDDGGKPASQSSGALLAMPDQVGQWGSVISWPIVAVHGILMHTGKVLMWEDHTDDPLGARFWDPGTGTFTSAPFGGANLFCSGHCVTADGTVLVDGGHIGLD